MVKKYQKNEMKDNLEREGTKNIKFKLPKKINVFWGSFGLVSKITDGIAKIIGIHDVGYGETIRIMTEYGEIKAIVLNIAKKYVSAAVFSHDWYIKPGQWVKPEGELVSIPVSDDLLGRIINPLGNVLDGLDKKINFKYKRPIETIAPSIISRKSVNVPLETGIKVIDSLVPIGHGQRELIIGDTKTGKTSIAVDSILNQSNFDTINIYVAIGQKRSSVARIAKVLKDKDCLKSSIIVAATASDSAALQYIAPYSGCAIGEHFLLKKMRVLIIYDDLSKHAISYRQLSLLLRRPPGREGYPGDVFFIHSRLLERAANLTTNGSITALPIVETIQGDVSAYIPTNVISITDGQLFLETELFTKGIRPSVSPGLSVSRVGSAAQCKTLKKMAGNLKLELAQYREVEGFAKLGFSLDDATKQLIDRGSRLTKMLVQNRFQPIPVYKQILFLYAGLNGFLDNIPVDFVPLYEKELYSFLLKSIFDLPLSKTILNNLDIEIVNYLIYYYSFYFLKFLKRLKLKNK